MFRSALLLVVCIQLAGCGNSAAKQGSGKPNVAPWAELEEFRAGPEMSVAYPAETGDWKAAKKAAGSEAFKAAVAKLEGATPPSGYPHKDDLVKALKELVSAGESGSPEDVKAKFEIYKQATAKLATR